MNYELLHSGVVIGHSELEEWDEDAGVISGVLYPTPAYEPLRPVFRATVVQAIAEANLEAYTARLRAVLELGLEVRSVDGSALSTRQVLVQDLTEPGHEDLADAEPWLIMVSATVPSRRSGA